MASQGFMFSLSSFLQLLLSGKLSLPPIASGMMWYDLDRHLLNKFYNFNIANVVDIVSRRGL